MNTEILTGTVQSVRFTQGSPFGEQWTTIDGVAYATWWDVRTKDWREGDRVHFKLLPPQECYLGASSKLICSPCAEIIGRVPD